MKWKLIWLMFKFFVFFGIVAKVVACDASGRGWGIDQFYIILQSFNKHYERAIIHLSINKHTWFKCMVTRR